MRQEMTAENIHLLIAERRRALAEKERREEARLNPGPLAAFGLAGFLMAVASLFGAG
jgi:hypothetical protein